MTVTRVLLLCTLGVAFFVLTLLAVRADRTDCSPGSQLPCYCKSIDQPVATTANLVAPCYPGGIQTATFLTTSLYPAQFWASLNWPASNINGVPDYDVALDQVKGDNATVWESWKALYQVFLPDGRAPEPWTSRQRRLPASCEAIDTGAVMAGYPQADLVPNALPPRFLTDYVTTEGDVLVDQFHQVVRFETLMNEVAFDEILANELYSADGQARYVAAGNTIEFPSGAYYDTRGSFWLKAAWKVLDASEDFETMHKAWAFLYPIVRGGTVISDCEFRPVGLVGLHITFKDQLLPAWGWATFEHEDVAPYRGDVEGAGGRYYFFDARCDGEDACAATNAPPAMFPAHHAAPQPSQLVREARYGENVLCTNPHGCEDTSVEAINRRLAERLEQSVWTHYRMKGTQWVDGSKIQPHILANTALEPYDQTTSSCLDCHTPATIKGRNEAGNFIPHAAGSDRIFALQRAQPEWR